MLRITRWSVPFALVLLLGCQDTPVAPEPFFGKGAGSPPNPEIAFWDATTGGRFLYVMNADGSARTRVATLVDGGTRSTWSRAGNGTSTQPYQLAYPDLMYDCSLFIVDVWVSGTTVMASPPRQVSRSAPTCYLAWSPIGPELAYSTGFYDGSVPGRKEVWLIGASGTNERLLYSSTTALTHLDWTRDGTHLVVVEKSDDYTVEGDRLLLIDVATGAGRTLYQSPVNLRLVRVDVANTSNDVLFYTDQYSRYPTTSTPSGFYRLPVGADFSAGTPQFMLWAYEASWSPDDTRLVIQASSGLTIYTLATRAKTNIGKGNDPYWRPQ